MSPLAIMIKISESLFVIPTGPPEPGKVNQLSDQLLSAYEEMPAQQPAGAAEGESSAVNHRSSSKA
jgi:hypothetical protein